MENWILAENINGDVIKVRQRKAFGDIFVDEKGNEYQAHHFDLTEDHFEFPMDDFKSQIEENKKRFEEQDRERQEMYMKMLSSMDANAVADHKAKIDEREYWRKLRGDIALEIIRQRGDKEYYAATKSFGTIASMTAELFCKLYDQDKDFFEDK